MKKIGVYRYILRTKEMLDEIISFKKNHKNSVFLNHYICEHKYGELFEKDRITILLYYLESDVQKEISKNKVLSGWYDSDCYDWDEDFIEKRVKDGEMKTFKFISVINELNILFNKVMQDE